MAEVRVLPVLPLRDIVVFPHMVVPLFVGREKSVRALDEAMQRGRMLVLASQRDAKSDDPVPADIYELGTIGAIVQLVKLPDGTVKVLVEGKRRAYIRSFEASEPCYLVRAEPVEESAEPGIELDALVRSVKTTFEQYVKLNRKVPPEMAASIAAVDSASRLADTVVAHLNLNVEDKQKVLSVLDPRERLEEVLSLMQGEIDVLQVESRIRSRVKKQMERSQKEYYLNEQMRAIQKELGERDEFKNEIQELEEKIEALKLPDH